MSGVERLRVTGFKDWTQEKTREPLRDRIPKTLASQSCESVALTQSEAHPEGVEERAPNDGHVQAFAGVNSVCQMLAEGPAVVDVRLAIDHRNAYAVLHSRHVVLAVRVADLSKISAKYANVSQNIRQISLNLSQDFVPR